MKKNLYQFAVMLFMLMALQGIVSGQATNALYPPEGKGNGSGPFNYINSNSDAPTATNILVYSDDYVNSPNFPVQALQNLGFSYTLYSGGNWAGFISSLTSGTWDLVIVDHETSYFGTAAPLDALNAYVLGGGCLVMGDFEAFSYAAHALWASMGFTVYQDYTTPIPIYWWTPTHPMFTSPNNVPQPLVLAHNYVVDGVRINALSTATARAGYTPAPAVNETCIVRSNNGKTVYMGFLDGNWNATDAIDLWENLIVNGCCEEQPPVPITNWALFIGIALIGTFIFIRYRRLI